MSLDADVFGIEDLRGQLVDDLLDQAGDLVEVNRTEDPKYHVADDRLA